jgi:hypothetical protein
MTTKKFNFKGFVKGAEVARMENERQKMLRSYKGLYYGLISILYPIWLENWKEYPYNSFRQERFYLAPGRRNGDGTYTYPEIDWEAYNEFRSQCWNEFLEDIGLSKPIELLPMRDIKASRERLIEFCQENSVELGLPEGETSVAPSEGQIVEFLIQVNLDNLKAKGAYMTQEPKQEVAF